VQQPSPRDPQENKLPVPLSYPPGKTALNVINKRGSIKSIILKAFEMQDAKDQSAQPQALSVLQHFSTNCEHQPGWPGASTQGETLNAEISLPPHHPSFPSPTPSRGRQKTIHTCFSLLSQPDFTEKLAESPGKVLSLCLTFQSSILENSCPPRLLFGSFPILGSVLSPHLPY